MQRLVAETFTCTVSNSTSSKGYLTTYLTILLELESGKDYSVCIRDWSLHIMMTRFYYLFEASDSNGKLKLLRLELLRLEPVGCIKAPESRVVSVINLTCGPRSKTILSFEGKNPTELQSRSKVCISGWVCDQSTFMNYLWYCLNSEKFETKVGTSRYKYMRMSFLRWPTSIDFFFHRQQVISVHTSVIGGVTKAESWFEAKGIGDLLAPDYFMVHETPTGLGCPVHLQQTKSGNPH